MINLRPNDRIAHQPVDAIIRRLSSLSQLSADDIATLGQVLTETTSHPTRSEIVGERKLGPSLMLTSGWACRQRSLSDGRRQIITFILPGDAIYPLGRPDLPAPCSAVALTPVITVDASALVPIMNAPKPGQTSLAKALRLLDPYDHILLRDQVVRLGRQIAFERMVHLMVEFHARLQVIGQVANDSFALPLTQEVLADALGLSVVHVNRVLQQIRRDRLLEMRGGTVTILDLDQMKDIADWAPLPAN